MFANRIKLDDELMEKVRKCAQKCGYASADEFVIHVLEKEVARILRSEGGKYNSEEEEEVKKRLQGLGYIE